MVLQGYFRGLWETIISSKLGLSKGFLAQLCGFLGGWEGVSPPV